MAETGHWVLRFDYSGNGDSEGEFERFTIDSARSDIQSAVTLVRERAGVGTAGLIGLRLGATLALAAAGRDPGIRALALWAPIVDTGRYMQDLLRVNLTTQMAVHKEIRYDRQELVAQMRGGRTVNIDGYEVALSLYEQVLELGAEMATVSFPGPVLVVQIDARPAAPLSRDLAALAERLPSAQVEQVVEEPFWKEIERFYETAPNLSLATMAWLDRL